MTCKLHSLVYIPLIIPLIIIIIIIIIITILIIADLITAYLLGGSSSVTVPIGLEYRSCVFLWRE